MAGSPSCGRRGLTCETILRCAVLIHLMGYSYRELEFKLIDSASTKRFARIDPFNPPKKSALQSAISAIDADTWQAINGVLVQDAKRRGIESGTQVRIDSTATDADILEPSDSRLLFDGVPTELLRQARERLEGVVSRSLPRRQAAAPGDRLAARRQAASSHLPAAAALGRSATRRMRCLRSRAAYLIRGARVGVLRHARICERVVQQTERRVFDGETVPAGEKVVSLFEPHVDIIVKGGRRTHYGHKINLSTGRSALVLDVVVEDGNPADSERCLPMLKRHVETYGEPPQRVAFDGGASRENLAEAKKLGVEHVMFHKKRGMEQTEMTPSAWIYGELRRFRAGVEAGISYLKRCFGLDRCRWSGREGFHAYVHSAVFAHNLIRLARLLPS